MRQYAYMNTDGSYQMFRRDSEPCLWYVKYNVTFQLFFQEVFAQPFKNMFID